VNLKIHKLLELKRIIQSTYPEKVVGDKFHQLRALHDSSLQGLSSLFDTEKNGVFAFLHDPTIEFLAHWCGEEAYREGIGWVDEFLGKIITMLREREIEDDTLVLCVSDHGMTFDTEDGYGTHGNYYSKDEVKYVPFVFNKKLNLPKAIKENFQVLDVVKNWLES
jgi:membrane-anchored protein YejM (alkaline phosphatase superfamily)